MELAHHVAITNLGSGSKGNATVILSGQGGVLIDNGFSYTELEKRCKKSHVNVDQITAIALTHEHQDHFKGVIPFLRKRNVLFYVAAEVYQVIENTIPTSIKKNCRLFSPGSAFVHDDLTIEPFSISHDTVNPVGFIIRNHDIKIGVATDLGCLSNLVKLRLSDCDLLMIESNYDSQMLSASSRPVSTKQRIHSRIGHLDNETTMQALSELLTPRTKSLILAHLSQECNSHDLVKNLVTTKLEEMNRSDIVCYIAGQEDPLPTIEI